MSEQIKKMDYNKQLAKAIMHNERTNEALKPIDEALSFLLDDDRASVFYQPSDGWVVFHSEDHNSAGVDLNKLMKMSKEDALTYLHSLSI